MSVKQTKCESCGANLEQLEDNKFYCPHCKSTYILTNDVNNTYITNNENVVKNFYGDTAVKNELDNEKIDGYFVRVYDYYFSGDYSNAKEYVMKILAKQSNNIEANILNNILSRVKGSNGRYRYVNLQLENFILIIKKWIVDKDYLHTSQNFEKLLNEKFNYHYNYIIDSNSYYNDTYAKEYIAKLQIILEVIANDESDELKNFKEYITNMVAELNKYNKSCIEYHEHIRIQEEQSNKNIQQKKYCIHHSLF